jgi:hypothetical protein
MLYLPHSPWCESGSRRQFTLRQSGVDPEFFEFGHVYLHDS